MAYSKFSTVAGFTRSLAITVFIALLATFAGAQKTESAKDSRIKAAKAFIAQAEGLMESADIDKALLLYKQALNIDKDGAQLFADPNVNLVKRIADAMEAKEYKVSLQDWARKGKYDVTKIVKKRSGEADASLEKKHYAEASKAYRQIWLLSDGSDKTAYGKMRRAEQLLAGVAPVPKSVKPIAVAPVVGGTDPVKAQLDQAEKLVDAEQYDAAIVIYEAVLKVFSTNKTASKGLAKAKKEKQEKEDDQILAEAKKAVEVALLQSEKLRDQGESQRALELLAAVQSKASGFQKWRVSRAMSRLRSDQDDSKDEAREVALVKQADRQVELDKIQAEKEAAEAELLAEAARELEKKINGRMDKANAAYKGARFEEAVAIYQSVLQLQPGHAEALVGKERAQAAISRAELSASQAMETADRVARTEEARKAREAEAKEVAIALQKQSEEDARIAAIKNAADAKAKAELETEQARLLEIKKEETRKVALQAQAEKKIADEKMRAEIEKQRKVADLTLQADQALARKDYTGAITFFQAIDKVDPDNARIKAGIDNVLFVKASDERMALEAERTLKIKAEQAAGIQKEEARIQRIEGLMFRALEAETKHNFAEAMQRYQDVLDLEPEHVKAKVGLTKARVARDAALTVAAEAVLRNIEPEQDGSVPNPFLNMDDKTRMQMARAKEAYDGKGAGIVEARKIWEEILAKDASNKMADIFLQETLNDYETYMAEQAKVANAQKRDADGAKILEIPITISTVDPDVVAPSLPEFLDAISLSTGINFSVAAGEEARIHCNFVDLPLREVLDSVLLSKGLKWERTNGSTILVSHNLKTKTFGLSREIAVKVRTLIEIGALQRTLYGDDLKPLKGTQLQLDEREGILLITDSQAHINMLAEFLESLKAERTEVVVHRTYQIKPEDGKEVKRMIEAIIQSDNSPLSLDRTVVVEDSTLILVDTLVNIQRFEREILPLFTSLKGRGKLEARVFDIIRPQGEEQNLELDRKFFMDTYEVITTILYADEGEAAAHAKGRRIWPKADELEDIQQFQITVTDYVDRLQTLAEYLDRIGEPDDDMSEYVADIKFQIADALAGDLNTVLGLSGDTNASSSSSEDEISFTLSNPEKERTFRDLTIRLIRIESSGSGSSTGSTGSSSSSSYDDQSAEFNITISGRGATSQRSTIREYESEMIDDYEVTCEEIRTGGGEAGGRAKVRIRYIAPEDLNTLDQGTLNLQTPVIDEITSTLSEEEEDLQISSFGQLNALIIRYRDANDLRNVLDLIEKLDRPTPQVAIVTEFVTVNEDRFKEFRSRFTFRDLADPTNFVDTVLVDPIGTIVDPLTDTTGDTTTDATDATDATVTDTSSDNSGTYTPGAGAVTGAALGTNAISGNFDNFLNVSSVMKNLFGQYVNVDLQYLEMEGVVNVRNGPHILVMDGETADFSISVSLDTSSSDNSNDDWEEQLRRQNSSTPIVTLDVEPEITSEHSIILEVNVEIRQTPTGEALGLWNSFTNELAPGGIGMPAPRKSIDTVARISNGGTIVIGGWNGEVVEEITSGIPGLRDLPLIGKLLFTNHVSATRKTNLLIFLSGTIVD